MRKARFEFQVKLVGVQNTHRSNSNIRRHLPGKQLTFHLLYFTTGEFGCWQPLTSPYLLHFPLAYPPSKHECRFSALALLLVIMTMLQGEQLQSSLSRDWQPFPLVLNTSGSVSPTIWPKSSLKTSPLQCVTLILSISRHQDSDRRLHTGSAGQPRTKSATGWHPCWMGALTVPLSRTNTVSVCCWEKAQTPSTGTFWTAYF